MNIILHDPVVVSQADPGLRNWGPWQFPAIQQIADGRLAVGYHIEADSATAYGKPPGLSLSLDGGQSWVAAAEDEVAISASAKIPSLPNGDLLRQVPLRSVDPNAVMDRLPVSVGKGFGGYRNEIICFDASLVPADLAGIPLCPQPPGRLRVEETATVRIPGDLRTIYKGVLTFPWMHRITQAPDGTLWGVIYSKRSIDGEIARYYEAIFLRSVDDGHNWDLRSSIVYRPDTSGGPHALDQDGFTEPNITFVPDGSIICLLRTTDANGTGQMYISRSIDEGLRWSTPSIFDDCGVWPAMLTLAGGCSLAVYGRPGLYLRATRDPSGMDWDEPVTVVEPLESPKDTCSYADLS
jgi:hypothetical protein